MLTHSSQITDDPSADWNSQVEVGRSVRALILNIDRDAKKVLFSMKPSRIQSATIAESIEEEEDSIVDEVEIQLESDQVSEGSLSAPEIEPNTPKSKVSVAQTA